jgi:hypothetical protein
MGAPARTLAINPDFYVVSRPGEAAGAAIEVVDDPRPGERYALLLEASDDDPFLEHLRSHPRFWLLHEPEVLREEGYMFPGDTGWSMATEAGRAMHALIYEIRAVECQLIGHGTQVDVQGRPYDRVTIQVMRSVPLLDFPAVFPRQTAPTVPGLDQPAPIEIDRVGDLVLAANQRSNATWTWALLLDRGSHAVALLSGDDDPDLCRYERFRFLWNLECSRVSDMVAAAQALVDAER